LSDLINALFYSVVLGVAVIFSLLALTFDFKTVDPDSRWKGSVYSGLSFITWMAMTGVHYVVVAIFDSAYLLGLAFLWLGLGVFFLVFLVYQIFQVIAMIHEEKNFRL
jgi:hypothetical protein